MLSSVSVGDKILFPTDELQPEIRVVSHDSPKEMI